MNLYDRLLEKLDGQEYSHYFATFCPFDSHKSPALLIYQDGMAKCLSCEKWYTHEQIARKIRHGFMAPQRDTVSKILPRWKSWEGKYGDLEGIVENAHRIILRYPQFQNYLKKRKYEKSVIEAGRFGYLDGWLVIPVFDVSHSLVDIVVRAVKGKGETRYVIAPKADGTRPLYSPNWSRVLKNETVYVVYGIFDSLAIESLGLPCVTGITGKSLNADILQPLHKRFVIIPDAGEEREARILANDLGWRAKVKLPDYDFYDVKDPDELRLKHGEQTLLGEIK